MMYSVDVSEISLDATAFKYTVVRKDLGLGSMKKCNGSIHGTRMLRTNWWFVEVAGGT